MNNQAPQTDNSTFLHPDEARLQAALKSAYPTSPSGPDLRQRLALLVEAQPAQSAARARRKGQLRLAGATLAVAAGLVIGVMGDVRMRQATAGSAILRKVDAAVSHVQTAHIVEWWNPRNEGKLKYRETWYRDRKWREEHGEPSTLTVLRRDRKRYELFGGDTKVRVSYLPKDDAPLTMSQMLYHYALNGMRRYVRRLPDAVVAGRPARRLLLELPDCPPHQAPAGHSSYAPQRAIVAVDPQTDLPFHTETQAYRWWRWETVLISEARYNEDIPEERFAANFPGKQILMPQDVKVEADQQRHKHMAESGAKAVVGTRTVTLRHIDGSELGDTFVFYTVSGPQLQPGVPLPWTVELRDQSSRYWKPMSSGVVGNTLPHLAPRWTFGGERLHVAWYQPNRRGSIDEGGQWQVTFRLPDGTATLTPERWSLGGGPVREDDELYDEFVLAHGEDFAKVCQARANWLRSGGWLADSGLLGAAFAGGYNPREDADHWDEKAAQLRRRMARLTGQTVAP